MLCCFRLGVLRSAGLSVVLAFACSLRAFVCASLCSSALLFAPKAHRKILYFSCGVRWLRLSAALRLSPFRFVSLSPFGALSLLFCFQPRAKRSPLLRAVIQRHFALWSRSRWFAFLRLRSPRFCSFCAFCPFFFVPVLAVAVFPLCFLWLLPARPRSLSSLRPLARDSPPGPPSRFFVVLSVGGGFASRTLRRGGSAQGNQLKQLVLEVRKKPLH